MLFGHEVRKVKNIFRFVLEMVLPYIPNRFLPPRRKKMEKNIRDKKIEDLKISKPAQPESIKGAGVIKNALQSHLNDAHRNKVYPGLGHCDIPHTNININWKTVDNVSIRYEGVLHKNLAEKFAGLGATIKKNEIVIPKDKIQEYEKMLLDLK